MSAGHIDEEALAAAKVASARAAQRGEKIVSMTSHTGPHGRSFSFGYAKVEKPRKARGKQPAGTTECDWYYGGACTCGTPHRRGRGVQPAMPTVQGKLL
jgi:hypothetical protein